MGFRQVPFDYDVEDPVPPRRDTRSQSTQGLKRDSRFRSSPCLCGSVVGSLFSLRFRMFAARTPVPRSRN